ncbi:MAG: hypothetical protein K1X29_04855 [Bdellovibrionales bacterium]|nr:hypothetical protein [Bdellovibrionales bacterium]
MARPLMIMVSDNRDHWEKMKTYGLSQGYSVQCYTVAEWGRGLGDGSFRQNIGADMQTSLAVGSSPLDSGAKILQFPVGGMSGDSLDKKVRTINELESVAIEDAINEYEGNLTEAAKALGIGRATLYRKVKQYNIDPTLARKKRGLAA